MSAVEPSSPECPNCGSRMKIKIAKKGFNAGNEFWGCTRFPQCRGTVSIQKSGAEPAVKPRRSSSSLPVSWPEGFLRDGFTPQYVSVGAIPGIFRKQLESPKSNKLNQALSQFCLLSSKARERQSGSSHTRLCGYLVRKILQRGLNPLPTLRVEQEAIRLHGALNSVKDLSEYGSEVGWESVKGVGDGVSADSVIVNLIRRKPFNTDLAVGRESEPGMVGSGTEALFLDEWIPRNLGPTAGHWFIPQAPLDTIAHGAGIDEGGERRVDFLFCHPGADPFAIEIDGPDHDFAASVDADRDELLGMLGIDVIRVSNKEVRSGNGPNLNKIRSRADEALKKYEISQLDDQSLAIVSDCSTAAKVQFAITRALDYGWLGASGNWRIDIRGGNEIAAQGVLDLLEMLTGFDTLYGGTTVPDYCEVKVADEKIISWLRGDNGEWRETKNASVDCEQLRIFVEMDASPYHNMPNIDDIDLIIRPAFVPVSLAIENYSEFTRQPIAASKYKNADGVLRMFLRNIFRKYDFRPSQGEAVFNALRHNDCVVLLPTGAGKSIIYQLAGLLMPGITLVVDPIIALIEDQVEGLQSYGIDRTLPLAMDIGKQHEKRESLGRVERGEFYFVLISPERLQNSQFRSSLRSVMQSSMVNLAVIDEAHCVSDWGHDFRTAYLSLSTNLRKLGADKKGSPPPLIALTGTASRAVLRDVLLSLEIDRSRSDALIRPESFDRSELEFEIMQSSPVDPAATLRGILIALPQKFNRGQADFFRAAGRETASGIIFVPRVNSENYGILDAKEIVRNATQSPVAVYSGSSPRNFDDTKWSKIKRQNATDFKDNKIPILVATKAFGMGIDKPNIRYTVHFGMPSSLENFYQEAGRAGRDRRKARCIVVFSELSRERTDRLLDPDIDLETLRKRNEVASKDYSSWDDVTRALWSHLQAFAGAESEMEKVRNALSDFGELGEPGKRDLPMGDTEQRKLREKAIYRLLRLGVIDDYEVDYGGRKFIVHIRAFNAGHCKNSLIEYIRAAQPAKSKLFADKILSIDDTEPSAFVEELCQTLIDFSYDIIERSRRRMIQEAVLLARNAQDDSKIRKRLLDYLQEGFGSEQFDELLRREEMRIWDWWVLIDKIENEMDAGEIRGLCVRNLESYPDHPGLLFVRAVSESMSSDHDWSISSKGLASAIGTAAYKYAVSALEIKEFVDGLLDFALSSRPTDLGLSASFAILDLCDKHPELSYLMECVFSKSHEFNNPVFDAVVANHKLNTIAGRLETVTDTIIAKLNQT